MQAWTMEKHIDLIKAENYSIEAEKLEAEIGPEKCDNKGCSYCVKHQKAYSLWQMAYNAIKRFNRKIANSPFYKQEMEYMRNANLHSKQVNDSCISQVDDDEY